MRTPPTPRAAPSAGPRRASLQPTGPASARASMVPQPGSHGTGWRSPTKGSRTAPVRPEAGACASVASTPGTRAHAQQAPRHADGAAAADAHAPAPRRPTAGGTPLEASAAAQRGRTSPASDGVPCKGCGARRRRWPTTARALARCVPPRPLTAVNADRLVPRSRGVASLRPHRAEH